MSEKIFDFGTELAWFHYDPDDVIDSLRVIFHSEVNNTASPACVWHRFSEEAKRNRIIAIAEALTDITLDKVQFKNREACRINDDISNLYDLFMVLHEHPSAQLVHILSRYADGITELDSDGDLITVEQLLKTFAHFIEEDILDIEAEVYSHVNNTDETSPVEEFKTFMKEQYDKHKDRVDAMVDAYNYIANLDGIDVAYNDENKAVKTVSDNDHVNHPKHYQASNGLEAIDCIEAFVEDLPGDIGYLIGNAMKYLCRFDKKGKPVEDLQKARWYIERAIKVIESRKM